MAYVKPEMLFWAVVAGAAEYPVYLNDVGVPLVQDPKADGYQEPLTIVTADQNATTEQTLDMTQFGIEDGKYDVYVCARDARGNESNPLVLANSVLDLTPPPAPASGGLR